MTPNIQNVEHASRLLLVSLRKPEARAHYFSLAFFGLFGGQIFGCGGAALRHPRFKKVSTSMSRNVR